MTRRAGWRRTIRGTGFVAAPPAGRPEAVRIAAIGRALDALESAGASYDIPVDADVDIDPHIHADSVRRVPMPEPPADPWDGWERMYDHMDVGPEAEIDNFRKRVQYPNIADKSRSKCPDYRSDQWSAVPFGSKKRSVHHTMCRIVRAAGRHER